MINILFLNHDAALGGAEVNLLKTLRTLDRSKFVINVWLGSQGLLEKEVNAIPQLKVHRSVSRRLKFNYNPIAVIRDLYSNVSCISRIVKQERIGILYANSFRSAIYAAIIKCFQPHLKFVWHKRHSTAKNLAFTFIASNSDLVLTNSNSLRSELITYSVGSDKIKTIYNGIDFKLFEKYSIKESVRQPGVKQLVCIGKIVPAKGQLDFIKLIEKLNKERDCIGTIVGKVVDYEYYAVCKNYIKAKDLGATINFVDETLQVYDIIAMADVLISVSYKEAFGMAILESLACKTPVTAYDVGGVKEVVGEALSPLVLVPAGDIDAMSHIVIKLLSDSNYVTKVLFEADRHIKRFDISNCRAETEKCLENLFL